MRTGIRTTDWRTDGKGRHKRGEALRGDALRRGWAEFLSRVPWQWFVTLTFDPKRVFPVNSALASREAFWWCNEASRLTRRPLGWVYAPERGRSGLWHVHALIVGAPSRLRGCQGMWDARNGRIDVRRVHDVHGLTLYTSKQAALSGELVWSDTLGQYFRPNVQRSRIGLFPEELNSPVDFGSREERQVAPPLY